jgi:hypothetical protein
MTFSLQKLLLVLLFKCLFVSCIATNLRLSSDNSSNLNKIKSSEKEDKDDLSLIEKKIENKQTPVN